MMDASADKAILEKKAVAGSNKFIEGTDNTDLNFLVGMFVFLWKKAFNITNIISIFRSPSSKLLEIERIRLNYEDKGVNTMSESTLQPAKIYEPFSYVIAWYSLKANVAKDLSKEQSNFCLDYSPATEQEIVQWIKINRANFSRWKKPLMGITVFARFEDLKPGESIRLTKLFGNAGAVLNDYPQETNSFIEAVKIFNDEVVKVRDRAKIYKEKRKKLAKETTVAV